MRLPTLFEMAEILTDALESDRLCEEPVPPPLPRKPKKLSTTKKEKI